MLENEKKDYIQRINLYHEKCNQQENEISRIAQEKNTLAEALSRTENEKSELFMRLNNEANTYQEMILSKNSEYDNLKWVHYKHSNLLASQNIGMLLEKFQHRLNNYVFSKIRSISRLNKAKNIGLIRIMQLPEKYFWRKQKYFLDVWRSHLS